MFVVTTTNDAGAGRQGILNTNGLAGADTINFNIAGAGVKTINMPLTPERVWRAIRELMEILAESGWCHARYRGDGVA